MAVNGNEKKYRAAISIFCGFAVVVVALFAAFSIQAATETTVSGKVFDYRGPLADVRVLVQGTKNTAVTDREGRFILSGITPGQKISLSAWKEGYYNALLTDIKAPAKDLHLTLIRIQLDDNPKYEWIPPEKAAGSCKECHIAITAISLRDAHMRAAKNPIFLNMYYGTDSKGNRSPPTRYATGTTYGPWSNTNIPLQPDYSKPYYGPGYQLDFPGTPGNCSSCHIPGASINHPVDPQSVKGADRYGVHCDFCHKVADVRVDPETRMANPDVPGVRAMTIKRPFADDPQRCQLFFGAFEDVNAPADDAYLPLIKESRFCAACHVGTFWDTLVYNSYGEWLQSPYADLKSGKAKTCQECHMPSPTRYKGKTLTNIAPGKGGIERDPKAIHNHNMTVDAELLRNSLTMSATAKKRNGRIEVAVTLLNDKTGHHIPTDSPLRQLILTVEARDSRGRALKLQDGPTLPEWCGNIKGRKQHYAGRPGKAYAKLLKEKWTDVFPTGAYWNHTELVSDNRLAALASDTSTYAFEPPQSGKIKINVTLLYRRAFIELMEQKKWNVPDIVMARQKLAL